MEEEVVESRKYKVMAEDGGRPLYTNAGRPTGWQGWRSQQRRGRLTRFGGGGGRQTRRVQQRARDYSLYSTTITAAEIPTLQD